MSPYRELIPKLRPLVFLASSAPPCEDTGQLASRVIRILFRPPFRASLSAMPPPSPFSPNVGTRSGIHQQLVGRVCVLGVCWSFV